MYRIMKKYLCFILIMTAAPAMAALVTLTTPDTIGQSSFNSGLHWSDGLAPSMENDYQVSIAQLHTPADGDSYVFGGGSLIINPGGVLMYKGTGTFGGIGVSNLIANGGSVIDHRSNADDVCTLYGNIHIAADSVMYAKQGPINVYSAISGNGTITNPGSDGPGCILTFYSTTNTFTGSIINNGRFVLADDAVLNFVIGASGVNNSVSGTGPQTTFDGDFKFDLSNAGMTYGDSWQIAGAAGQTFGNTFSVVGFVDVGGGFWVTYTNGIFYQFNESSGILSVFWPGNGTHEDPYQIWTPQQMNTIGLYPEIWACHFKLMADLDMSACGGNSYNIIGSSTSTKCFSGTFNGNDHIIANLIINQPDNSCIGLCGILCTGGQIYDLRVENATINGGSSIGIICGFSSNGVITQCYATGTVSGYSNVGGLCGENQGQINQCSVTSIITGEDRVGGLCGWNALGIITQSNAAGVVTGTYPSMIGGLCGSNEGQVSQCFATGTVAGYSHVGGLCGVNSEPITQCYSTCTVTGFSCVGGLCGSNSVSPITRCYATGLVTGNDTVGGLCGLNYGQVTQCYVTGVVTGKYSGTGGLCGYNNGEINQSYATGAVTGHDAVGGLCGGNRGPITQCYTTGTVIGFSYVGGLCGGNDGPITECYSTCIVIGDEYVGGLCGYKDKSPIIDCFWDTQTCDQLDGSVGIGKTTAEMQTISTFTSVGWDFSDTDGDPADWRMPPVSSPHLAWENFLPSCGDKDHPYPVMDFNQDCRVDLADFALFAAHWLECTAPECD